MLSLLPARTEREAMDWSLVLVSQGIEATIDFSAEDQRWGLLVPAPDYERALGAIRLYRLENPRWPWQREVPRAGLVFDWGSLAWVALVAAFFWLSTHAGLRTAGIMDSVAVEHGEWWRVYTAVWLHADLGHLATNLALGFVLLGLAMGLYGTGPALLAGYLAGVCGNVAAWLLSSEPHAGLGASGMVMGVLGLLATHSFSLWRKTPHALKLVVSSVCGGIMIFVLLGLTPGTDVVAHAGGFVSGLFFGWCLTFFHSAAQKPAVNLAAGLLFAVLVVFPWWLALRS